MEDGIEEIRDFVLAETKNLEGETRASGLVKNLIVNLVPAGNYAGDEEGKTDEKSGGLTEDGRKEENQKEGGIINHLISNLVSPRKCPTPKEEDEMKVGTKPEVESEDLGTCFKSEEEVEGGGGGGIINNLISNMFHHQDGSGEEKDGVEKEEKAEVAGGGGGRSGIVNELISNLPATLAENAVPGTDEASMLIHSIVHD